MTGLAIIDFETTGFIPEQSDRVVEVGLVLADPTGQIEYEWTTLVNPKRDIGASHIHGIQGRDLLNAPEFPEISPYLIELIDGRALVAHNAPFDMRFLYQELLRAGYNLDDRPAALCSMKWSQRLLGPAKLDQCCEALGIELFEAHTALADAHATTLLVQHLIELGGDQDWLDDLNSASAFDWPMSPPSVVPPNPALRNSTPPTPSSWMASLLADTWVKGETENETAYLLALDNALLDFHISASEGQRLVDIASNCGLDTRRVRELHLEHLNGMAAEAWSDGILTDDEITDLAQAAACMGLTDEDLQTALAANREVTPTRSKFQLGAGDRIVFTGVLDRPRDNWVREIVGAGLVTGGISKSTKVVVSGDPDSLSGKAAKARSYGIPIISEEAFAGYFTEYINNQD